MDSYQETETRSGGENGEGDEDEIRSATHLSLSTPAMNKEDTFELFFWGEEAAFVNWLCRMPMILASLSPHPLYIFLVFPTRLCRDFTCAVSSTPLPFPISHFPNYMACRLRTWPLDLLPLSLILPVFHVFVLHRWIHLHPSLMGHPHFPFLFFIFKKINDKNQPYTKAETRLI